jgi:hypothetical protein
MRCGASTKNHEQQSASSPLVLDIAMVIIALAVSGCVSAPALVRALAEDPAAVCISVTTIYGKGAACRIGNATEVKASDGAISLTSK